MYSAGSSRRKRSSGGERHELVLQVGHLERFSAAYLALSARTKSPLYVEAVRIAPSDIDTVSDATVLLVGRGAAYPALSVSLGERTGVVGALSIEAAARHLNARDIDGIVLAEGFGARVIDAFRK